MSKYLLLTMALGCMACPPNGGGGSVGEQTTEAPETTGQTGETSGLTDLSATSGPPTTSGMAETFATTTSGSTGGDTSGETSTSSSTGAETGCEVVEFADGKLEAVVREALAQPEGPLLGKVVAQLKELEISDAGIVQLQGLECAVGLEVLGIYGLPMVDLSPLAELVALEELGLSGTHVADLSPLAELPVLRTLSLGSTEVVDLWPIAGLSTLEEVSIANTAITDLSPLAGLTALLWLKLDDTPVTDLGPLAGTTALAWLSMNNVAAPDLSPLTGHPIAEMYARNCGISDIGPIATFPAPWHIELQMNAIVELDGLKGATWDASRACADIILEENPLSEAAEVIVGEVCEATHVAIWPPGFCPGYNTCIGG